MVGAGTVLNADQARAAQRCRCTLHRRAGTRCRDRGKSRARPAGVPGVATATEVQAAYNLGLRIVKYFPAGSLGGPPALRALAEAFRDMRFMPTGGVREADLREYLGMPVGRRLRRQLACATGADLGGRLRGDRAARRDGGFDCAQRARHGTSTV